MPPPSRPVGGVVVGVDVGTTAVKVSAFPTTGPSTGAVSGAASASSQREYPLEQPRPGWEVQDPTAVLAAVDAALADCVGRLGDTGAVVGLSLSTALHGLAGLDADLRPLTPLLTWADSRAHAESRELRESGQALDLLRRTGTPVHPMSPLVKLMWFTRQDRDLADRVRWWVGLKELVLEHLTGRLATELSSASATGLLDVSRRTWDDDAVALAGITRDQLAPVLATTTVLRLSRPAAERTGLPAGLPVAVGAADGPLGNLGTGAVVPGVAGLSLGTSGAVRMAVPGPTFDPAGRLFCYALTDDLWLSGGAVSNGGIVLRWAGQAFAADLLGHDDADAAVLALAEQVPAGSEGLVMLPYLLGERAPLWDPSIPGAYVGVRRHHTRAHFVRAALEGVCLQLSTIVDALDDVSPVRSVRATGGTLRSTLWRQALAATLDRPFSVQGDAGGTALGAAALGWFALGGARTLTDALVAVGGSVTEAGTVVDADAGDVAAYAGVRAGLPALLAAYGAVGEALAAARPGIDPASDRS